MACVYLKAQCSPYYIFWLADVFRNPLNPNIHIQILQTGIYTFPQRISKENLIKDKCIFSSGDYFINSHNLFSDAVRRKLKFVTLHLGLKWLTKENTFFWGGGGGGGGLPQVHQYFTVKCYLPTGGSDFFASITLLYKMYLTFISSFIALGWLIIIIFINVITALRKKLKACSVIKRVSKQDWGVQCIKRPKLCSKQVQQF